MCNVKGVTHSDKPTDQIPSVLQTILVSLSSLFWLYRFGSVSLLFSAHYLSSPKQQTEKVSD